MSNGLAVFYILPKKVWHWPSRTTTPITEAEGDNDNKKYVENNELSDLIVFKVSCNWGT